MSGKTHTTNRKAVIWRRLWSLPALGLALTLLAMQPAGAAEETASPAASAKSGGAAPPAASPRLVNGSGNAVPKRTLIKRGIVKSVADEGSDFASEAASNPGEPSDDRMTCQAGCGGSLASDTSVPVSTVAASDPSEAEGGNALSCLAGCYAGAHVLSLARSAAAAMPASAPAADDDAEKRLPKRATSSASRHLVKRHVLGGSGDWFRRINRDRTRPAAQ